MTQFTTCRVFTRALGLSLAVGTLATAILSPLGASGAFADDKEQLSAPVAPAKPAAIYMGAEDSRGTPGATTPARVLIEWHGVGQGATFYDVEQLTGSSWRHAARVTASSDGDLERLIDVEPKATGGTQYAFRVCAGNIAGTTCSASATTRRLIDTVTSSTAQAGSGKELTPSLPVSTTTGGATTGTRAAGVTR